MDLSNSKIYRDSNFMETLRREENNSEEFFFRIKIGSFQFNNLWNLWTNSMETLRR